MSDTTRDIAWLFEENPNQNDGPHDTQQVLNVLVQFIIGFYGSIDCNSCVVHTPEINTNLIV